MFCIECHALGAGAFIEENAGRCAYDGACLAQRTGHLGLGQQFEIVADLFGVMDEEIVGILD